KLPRGDTGVLVGNSLTGEFSRAATLRLRWPYVRRVLGAVLRENGTGEEERGCLLRDAESLYKAPFPAPGEETLAGGLSNTIAGRICNHFDLGGGGYTLDGACCSSLLAVAQGCSALEAGDVEVMVAGGVDLSLDPFELVGFARTGALAPTEMRVYDRRSAGFWPGEGCGFVVLMREREARRRGLPIVATIRGWGISSDGAGGLTRPEVCGQRRALQRAYRRAGFGIDTVPYIEGHGTGTPIGDTVELKAISEELREAGAGAAAAAIGSVKANFGHTKAAAGVAGLIKAAVVLEHRVLPPTTASEDPHGELDRPGAPLRTLREGETWLAGRPLRAAVSSAGFGGINVHLVLERAGRRGKRSLDPRTRRLLHSAQDAELILLAARNRKALRREIDELRASAHRLSRAELADLSVHLARRLDARLPARVAVVADTPQRLAGGLRDLSDWLDDDVATRIDARGGVFLGTDARPRRVGLLFTGQGSPSHLDGGAMRRRFGEAADLYRRASLPEIGDPLDAVETSTAQPAIVCASLAALRVLRRAGIEARGACGHSLGELTALAWGGAFSEQGVLRLAAARGRLMSELASAERGAMAALAAAPADVERWLEGSRVVIAGYNGAHSTVISGSEEAVEAAIARARADGCPGTRLRVSHAFHSPLMEPVVGPFSEHVAGIRTRRLTGRVFSTVSGGPVAPGKQLRELLRRQLTSPVRFHEALGGLAGEVDLLLEVGPGRVLSSLAAHSTEVPAVPLDAGGASLDGLLSGIGGNGQDSLGDLR
ncbi:MAG: acyltransferase domain-containing protein, partial [Planctomycetota bacterium]